MTHISIVKLVPERLCEALWLVELAYPGLDQSRWRAHCEALACLGGGVLAAAAPDGALHGLAVFRPDEDLRHGKVVRVDMLIAFELNPAGPVRELLLAAVETVRRDIEAHGILLVVQWRGPGGRAPAVSATLERIGFRHEADLLWKPLAGLPNIMTVECCGSA